MLLWTQAGAKSNIQQTIGMGALSVPHSCLDCSMQPVIEECHSNPLWCSAMLCSKIHNWALVHGLQSYLQAHQTTPRKESTSLLLFCTPSHNLFLAIPHFGYLDLLYRIQSSNKNLQKHALEEGLKLFILALSFLHSSTIRSSLLRLCLPEASDSFQILTYIGAVFLLLVTRLFL
jgi:hypothetical protein